MLKTLGKVKSGGNINEAHANIYNFGSSDKAYLV